MESAGGGQFGSGFKNTGHDHGDHQVTLGAAGAGEDRLQAEATECTQGSGDVTVGRGAQNLEGIGGGDEGFALEHAPQGVDLSCRPRGEVGEGALDNLAVHARGFPKEDGRRGIAVGDGLNVHGTIISHIAV